MATIKSHKDAAYQAAKANDALQDAAKFVFDHCPTVLDGMPDDVKADLNDGWMLRYSEKHPEQIYVRVDGNLILPSGKVPEKAEKVQVSVFSAMSYSQQMFGQLKNIDPGLHGVIKTWYGMHGSSIGETVRKTCFAPFGNYRVAGSRPESLPMILLYSSLSIWIRHGIGARLPHHAGMLLPI
jgi:hypothetical protein